MRARSILLGAVAVVSLVSRAVAAPAGGRDLEGVVNLNTASPEQLQLLPGVGPAKVRNILAYRRAHPFRTPEELVRIKGIGRKMVRRLRLHLAVAGPTTAQRVFRAPAPPPDESAPAPKPSAPPPTPPRKAAPRASPFPCSPANHCQRPR